jgi:hypothetical protein
VLSSKKPPSGKFLKKAYKWPLQPPTAELRRHCDAWLWEAVHALRVEAHLCGNNDAYAMTLIGYFLRLARIKDVPRRKRAVAVCIADWLLGKLNDKKKAKKKTAVKAV